MSIDSLNIKRNKYKASSVIEVNLYHHAFLMKIFIIKYLRKRDPRHLANFRNVHINDNNTTDDIINALQNRINFLNSIQQQPQKLRQNKMLSAIRGYPFKKQQQAITKSLKDL